MEEHRASTCHGAEDHGRVLSVRRVAPPPPTARQTSQETGAASSTTESPGSKDTLDKLLAAGSHLVKKKLFLIKYKKLPSRAQIKIIVNVYHLISVMLIH